MVRSSRRQTLLRTTLPAVEHVEPSEGAALDFSPQPADEADQQTAAADVEQKAEHPIDADRLLPVLIQEMNLSLIILLPIANKFHKFHGPPTLNCPRNVKPVTSQKSHAISEVSRAINLQFLQERQPLPLAKSHTRPNVNLNQKTKFHQVRQAPAWSSKH